MGSLQIDIRDNEILRDVWEEVMAEGEARGEADGMMKILRGLLHAKFGTIPKWAEQRLAKDNKAQIERWSKKFINAQSLEAVIGKK